ncbi:hypothetical protein QG37_04159 [Candidozyma auris]|uniref:Uncharacterized protein n=1 Tax=Candidozyma auris TaxID=498019 RepID=A0A0L0NY27_CANAR|nr:hypothetical protein QG37_04159 [[Candida] auris]
MIRMNKWCDSIPYSSYLKPNASIYGHTTPLDDQKNLIETSKREIVGVEILLLFELLLNNGFSYLQKNRPFIRQKDDTSGNYKM